MTRASRTSRPVVSDIEGQSAPAAAPAVDSLAGTPADGSRDARQLAAAILEVLAGAQTPGAAAQTLRISLPRYYQLEGRALAGLVSACAVRRRGRGRAAGNDLGELRRECERLRRECARQQALARVSRRAVGLVDEAAPPATQTEHKPKRRRRPAARALKKAAELREEVGTSPPATSAAPTPEEAPHG